MKRATPPTTTAAEGTIRTSACSLVIGLQGRRQAPATVLMESQRIAAEERIAVAIAKMRLQPDDAAFTAIRGHLAALSPTAGRPRTEENASSRAESGARRAEETVDAALTALQGQPEAVRIKELEVAVTRYKADKDHEVAVKKIEADERVAGLQTQLKRLEGENALALEKEKGLTQRAVAAETKVERVKLWGTLGAGIIAGISAVVGAWLKGSGQLKAVTTTAVSAAPSPSVPTVLRLERVSDEFQNISPKAWGHFLCPGRGLDGPCNSERPRGVADHWAKKTYVGRTDAGGLSTASQLELLNGGPFTLTALLVDPSFQTEGFLDQPPPTVSGAKVTFTFDQR